MLRDMSKQSSISISMLLPVFQGGQLFLGAVESIEASSIPFEKIIISFNGSSAADYEAFRALQSNGSLKKKYTIYRTMKDLSAAEHGMFALNAFADIFHANSMLMFLAHDDRLVEGGSSTQEIKNFISHLKTDTVYFPSYQCCQAGDYENITHMFERDITYSTDEFFWLTMNESVPTNMSGMIVPFQAWHTAMIAAAKSQTGARFEHMLCISPWVNHINFNGVIKAVIGERPDSDGKKINQLEHRKAALAYVNAYCDNGHLKRLGRYPAFIYHLLRKYAAYHYARFWG